MPKKVTAKKETKTEEVVAEVAVAEVKPVQIEQTYNGDKVISSKTKTINEKTYLEITTEKGTSFLLTAEESANIK